MKFKELVDDADWEKVKQSLINSYDLGEGELLNYEEVLEELKQMEPEETKMRICIKWFDPDIKFDREEGFWAVDGLDGTLQKETEDFQYFSATCTEEFANSEVGYALDFTPWAEWLGMEIDPETANNIELMQSDIVAHCLWEMTFHGYEEENIKEILDELESRVEEFKSMTDEEKKKNCLTIEEMKERLKKLGEDIENIGGEEDENGNSI